MIKTNRDDAHTLAKVTDIAQGRKIKSLPELILKTKELFRQRRVDNQEEALTLRIGSDNYQLLNWSKTGLAFKGSDLTCPFKVGLKIGPTTIYAEKIKVFEGDIEIKTIRQNSDAGWVVGATFRNKLFLIEGIEAAALVNLSSRLTENHISEMAQIEPSVCHLILSMGSFLKILQRTCGEHEAQLKRMTFDQRNEANDIFLPAIAEKTKLTLDAFSKRLTELVDVDQIGKDSKYHQLFEEHIFPYLVGADMSRRALEKPRGYDGDYEMMNQVYRQDFEGTDIMGKVLHHCTANFETNESVQFRRPYFFGHMEQTLEKDSEPKTFLSVASGPAVEVQDAVHKLSQTQLDRTRFVLFDLDREALEHAQTKIYAKSIDLGKNVQADFINGSVKMFVGQQHDLSNTFDLIYSGGLFDYIDNVTSRIIVESLYQMLKPGGRLVIGNFTKAVTSKGFISLLLRWHLIYKTEAEMLEWAKNISDAKVRVEYDPKKINAFIVIEKG